MRERIDYIDKARGVLILLVIIGHIFQSGYVHNLIYSFHIPAFFIISGILFKYSNATQKSYKSIMISKLYTFGIPFIFFEVYGCLTYIVRFGGGQSIFGFLYNTLHLTFNNGVNWFLFTLFFGEMIFVIIKKNIRNKWGILAIATLCFISGIVLPATNSYIAAFAKILLSVGFLIIGYCFSDYLQTNNLPLMALSIVLTVLITYLNGSVDMNSLRMNNMFLFILGSITGTYLVIQLGRLPLGNLMNYIGKNTILIYGTHNALYVITGNLLGVTDFAYTPIFIGIIIFAIVLLVELPLVYIFNRYLPFMIGKKKKTIKS